MMNKRLLKRIVVGLLGSLIFMLCYGAWLVNDEFSKLESDDPRFWEAAIREFEEEDMHPLPGLGKFAKGKTSLIG